ncbi:MAG TPA: GAF domain-containing protein, partial [Thermoanaerobaculaceae bacterium]|nr:GAF domain-containing protein [Thermoanaerobaculaceae bacterium]
MAIVLLRGWPVPVPVFLSQTRLRSALTIIKTAMATAFETSRDGGTVDGVKVKTQDAARPRRRTRLPNEHRRILQRQAALYEISEAAHQAEDLAALYQRLHAIVARLMPAENIYIALYDASTDLVSYPYYVDQVDAPPLGPEPLGKGLTSYVLRTGQPLLATAEVFARMLRAGEVESVGAPSLDWLGVPLRVRDRTIGVMAIQTYTENVRYGEAERDLLVYVSNHVAQAIERKRTDWAIHESQRQLATLMSNLPGMA